MENKAEKKISRPGVYTGYSPVLYSGWKLFSQYITVRDGTKLAADIYRPMLEGKVVDKPHPVIWVHTPYNRKSSRPKGTPSAPYAGSPVIDRELGTIERIGTDLIKFGYVAAVVDFRGVKASYGVNRAFNRGEWSGSAFWDSYDITEWLAAQSWCDGNVGMWGCSGTGGSQTQVAATMAPHLKAIMPMCCEFDAYAQWCRGGVVGGKPESPPSLPKPIDPDDLSEAVPVDADTDGTMLKEALEQHKYNVGTRGVHPDDNAGYTPCRDSMSPWLGEKWWIVSSPYTHIERIKRSGTAIYSCSALKDIDRQGLFMGFVNYTNPRKILFAPGPHCQFPEFDVIAEELRWYDYWLKGIDNGIMDEPPIYYYTGGAPEGKEWRSAWCWPLPNEKRVDYYLGPGTSGCKNAGINDGTLSTTSPTLAGEKDIYTVDYDVNAQNQSSKSLTYTTAPLTSDVEVTGHPVIHLWISSSTTDADFLAYLEDVDEDGISSVVTDGKLRASHRVLHTPPYDNLGLPWHGSYENDLIPLIPDEPTELVFDLLVTSQIFKAGHRIRLTVTCADPPTLDRPESKALKFSPPPTITVYRNPVKISYITLPIIAQWP
ncbi:CocE/NonD family hydrolase [Chloroflexota bacterium]